MAKYPPSPPSLRVEFIGLRVFSTLVLVVAMWIGITSVQNGDAVSALRFVAGGASFSAATWVSPYSVAFLVFLGLPILILPATPGSGVIFTVIAIVALGWLIWSRGRPIRLDAETIVRAADDAVMPHAVPFVEDFTSIGWEQVGAVSIVIRKGDVISSLLLSPDRTKCAQVTDVVIAITSRFDNGRTLVTRNSGSIALPPWGLANDHRGEKPMALAIAHDDALRILEAKGYPPLAFDPDDVVDFFLAEEKRHIAYVADVKIRVQSDLKGSGPIDSSEASAQRIREWRMAEAPPD
jgi:propanediol utilization protein